MPHENEKIDHDYRAKQDPAWHWAHALWTTHRITPDQYQALLRRQNGCCAICHCKPGKKRLAIDHCHKTGCIRGLLCFRCNFGLSWFQDNSTLLKRASRHVTKRLTLKGT